MWKFNGVELKDEDIPKKALGFIYRITHEDGKWYIGRKNLDMAATRTVKGIKKKYRKPSDWKDYWSSSPALLAEIEENGKDKYSREILIFCETKASIAYGEEYCLFITGALFDPNCYNGNIRAKIMRSWFLKTPLFQKELEALNLNH